jgi:hypothetical protein
MEPESTCCIYNVRKKVLSERDGNKTPIAQKLCDQASKVRKKVLSERDGNFSTPPFISSMSFLSERRSSLKEMETLSLNSILQRLEFQVRKKVLSERDGNSTVSYCAYSTSNFCPKEGPL